jgi:hypothetical protein
MYIQEVGWGNVGWIDLAQDRNIWQSLVYTLTSVRVP